MYVYMYVCMYDYRIAVTIKAFGSIWSMRVCACVRDGVVTLGAGAPAAGAAPTFSLNKSFPTTTCKQKIIKVSK